MTIPRIICLTPVRNEATRLDAFLTAAATWADAIVVADQGSTDGSREIAASHPKVVLVENRTPHYDEIYRQRLLLDCARAQFPGPRVLIHLDADELLTAPVHRSLGWQAMLRVPPGTALLFRWFNLLPGATQAWVPPAPKRFGLVDDGTQPHGAVIHPGRLAVGPRPQLVLGDVGVVHLQLVDWPAMKAKHRWYQAWERIHLPHKRPVEIYRRYHWMDALPSDEIVPVDERWLAGYEETELGRPEPRIAARWDAAVLEIMRDVGTDALRKVDLWDHDWSTAARAVGVPVPQDPRHRIDRGVLRALAATQRKRRTLPLRVTDRAVALAGW